MHGIRIPACILIILLFASGCTSSPAGNSPVPGDDERYLDLLDTFSIPLNQSFNPNEVQTREIIAESQRHADEALLKIRSLRDSLGSLSVSQEMKSSKTSMTESLDDLEAMSRYILEKGYGEKRYADMTEDERVRADAYSLHAQDYAARASAVYDAQVCRAVQERYRNISTMCGQAR